MTQPDKSIDPDLIAGIARVMPELARGYDLVINLTHTAAAARLCECIPARERAGRINTYPGEVRVLGPWGKYLFAAAQNRLNNTFNLVDMYIGMGGVPVAPVRDYLPVSHEGCDLAMRLLEENGYAGTGRIVALQMGASKLHRAWPVRSFAALAEKLCASGGCEIAVLGTAAESALSTEFRSLFKRPFIDLNGKTNMVDLAAVLKQCALLVSNDTGTVHVAAAVGTRVLGLYFSTAYYAETAPYGQGNIILQPARSCAPCSEKTICADIACRDDLDAVYVADTASAMLEDKSVPAATSNVRAYQSRFLENGTLVYLPLAPLDLSNAERMALVFRAMWEEALGLEHDQALLQDISENPSPRGDLAWVPWLRECYRKASAMAGDILREFQHRKLNQPRVMELTMRLKSIEGEIRKRPDLPEIVRNYHELEMMDTAYAQYPEMARYLLGTYNRLGGTIAGFQRGLSVLNQGLSSET
ncbi:MAG TPA: glycosyltransferase family 9 protein [Deltaproteobacteria bacterium]|nr:glycosyltransferase family 9 protein [Deltaproteobacteria bacterium]